MKAFAAAAALLTTVAAPALAQGAATRARAERTLGYVQVPDAAPVSVAATPALPRAKPKLIVAISVDQFSADLYAQYRNRFTDGLARLSQGVVFPSGYQSHAATETCPGHSTILTGMRPAHTGIIANTWLDQTVGREDKMVYCAEDERVPGTEHGSKYVPSDWHLKVPTLGEMMKRADPATRVVSVAGKDRAAIMMGGHQIDQIWFWNTDKFVSYPGRATPTVVQRANDAVGKLFAAPQAALPLPGYCKGLSQPIAVGGQTLGTGRFERAGGDAKAFRASPALDGAVFALAAGMIQDMKLGQGPATDLIAIGASATDYIGHAMGTQGSEMCIQMEQLDQTIGAFLAQLDSWGLDYEVMLTADHGAHDMTERQQQRAMPMEAHVDGSVAAKLVGAAIGRDLGIAGPVLLGPESDVYIAASVPQARRAAVLAEAKKRYMAMPQVAAAYTRDEIAATPMATTPPELWTLLERARASYDPQRSGDLMVLLRPRITTIGAPGPYYVETHGSPWDYDRRVPILFWRKGMAGFEQPLSVETVDILPTLAATIGLPVSGLDGRCLDLDAGAADTCPR
ncbi:alkaline phosphatase [Sphingomonas ginsenosidimutans]|jgi:predicted AlkP superfamily pyrophosphatase or phosphodiesterase|uniref:Alkaline phosphatase n=1 Tax=Sphingomonas ginsenosidimutans TaxID=862134 RepID=A0A2A4I0G8_9SPHN|nr:alkaline phosphatase family protein [Sphingomonas ginsenosidimutans]PCG10276.1 alkaline phosphatase [Sphingomonas ginsenosidimutans]